MVSLWLLVFLNPLAGSAALSLQLHKCHESVAQQSSVDLLVDVNVIERTRHGLEVVGPDRLLLALVIATGKTSTVTGGNRSRDHKYVLHQT